MIRLYSFLAQVSSGEVEIPKNPLTQGTFQNVLQLVFGLAGAIALLIITVAGLKYVLSQGNPQETAKAKNTIISALIGLLVAILGYSIVTFVITKV